jgi:hypothetical protein
MPCNRSLKTRESIETPTPKMGTHLGVWRCIPSLSHIPTLPRHEMWLLGFTLGPHFCKPLPWSWAQGLAYDTRILACLILHISWFHYIININNLNTIKTTINVLRSIHTRKQITFYVHVSKAKLDILDYHAWSPPLTMDHHLTSH